MKRTVSLMLSFLLLIQLFSPFSSVFAEENGAEELSWGISYINTTYLEETVDVTREILEVDGAMAEPIHFEMEYTDYTGLSFRIYQRNGSEIKELIRPSSPSFDIDADQMEIGGRSIWMFIPATARVFWEPIFSESASTRVPFWRKCRKIWKVSSVPGLSWI